MSSFLFVYTKTLRLILFAVFSNDISESGRPKYFGSIKC